MSIPINYNENSIINPYEALQYGGFAQRYHLETIGATTDTEALWIARDETANAATVAKAASSLVGTFGVVTITPHASGGGRIQMNNAAILLGTATPFRIEAEVSFVTGGTYAVGVAEATANQSAIISSGAMVAGTQGAAIIVQTDDYCDISSLGTGDSANTAVTNMKYLTAGTYYKLGLKLWQSRIEAYVDGRLVGVQTPAAALSDASKPFVPFICTGATAAKILTIKHVSIASY